MKKVLVVDDDHAILDALKVAIEMAGYEVVVMDECQNVLGTTKDIKPDLVILDILLSGRDGREICQELKSDKTTRSIPVVLISAQHGVEKNVKDCGADDFLAKPFELDELLGKIERYVH